MWELDHKVSWVLKNWHFRAGVLEKTNESPLDYEENKPVNSKGNQPWILIGRTDTEAETPILWPSDVKNWLWKRPWCWERLKAGGEGDDRGWDGWMASLTRWTWVWVNSGSWWQTGRPGVLQSMGSQRVRHNWATEQLQEYLPKMRSATLQWQLLIYCNIQIYQCSRLYTLHGHNVTCQIYSI